RDIVDMGGSMRLGAYVARLRPDSQVARAYGDTVVYERHRHRYEVNTAYRRRLEDAGLVACGTSPDDRLVEFIELPGHPMWVGTQAHPEFKSRPDRPHPVFRELVGAALARADGRVPRLLDVSMLVARAPAPSPGQASAAAGVPSARGVPAALGGPAAAETPVEAQAHAR
ncbi:MAG: synthase, partial [Acidimicrobiaceae bacterium]|nr:synthase [Acidimicrobiaceae bacterium]